MVCGTSLHSPLLSRQTRLSTLVPRFVKHATLLLTHAVPQVITVGPNGAPASAYTITLTGVIMGGATPGSVAGITVATTTGIPTPKI
jgi:hypothetical protein